MKLSIYLILLSFLYISCSESPKQKIESKTISVKKNFTINDLITLPANFQAKYKIARTEDLSYKNKTGKNINRRQIRITIPSDLTRDELKKNIKLITKKIYNKYKPNGISILVYENGDNIMSAYTVAKGDFAPYGMWSKISSDNNLQNHKLSILINEAYFQPKKKTFTKGSTVKLFNKDDKNVALSKSINSWVKEDIIIYVPNNTKGKIIKVHKENIAQGYEFIRYKVSVSKNGKTYKGWVHDFDVK